MAAAYPLIGPAVGFQEEGGRMVQTADLATAYVQLLEIFAARVISLGMDLVEMLLQVDYCEEVNMEGVQVLINGD
jgi:hypothetical protein